MQEPNIGSQAAPAMHPSHGSHPSPVHSLPKFGIPETSGHSAIFEALGREKKTIKSLTGCDGMVTENEEAKIQSR